MPADDSPEIWRGQQLAAQVQAARRRVFFCGRHRVKIRFQCELCITESITGRPQRSVSEIMEEAGQWKKF